MSASLRKEETGMILFDKNGYPETAVYFKGIPQMETRSLPFPTNKPKKKDIIGHGLPAAQQKWKRTHVPKRLQRMQNSMSRKDLLKELLYNKKKYKEEWEHIDKMWDYRWNGMWFYNNGNITYITGNHWLYLNDWKIDGNYMKYRLTDNMYFIFLQASIEDPKCYGMLEVTRRREGKSSRAGCAMFYNTTNYYNSYGGIQSKTFGDAKDMFAQTIVNPWKALPIYFQPNFSNTSDPKERMDFTKPATRGATAADHMAMEGEELGGWIDTRSSEELAFDSRKLHFYIGDEEGKCLAKGTPVIMYDGSIKKVEAIVTGELLMGDDSTPRKVLNTTTGREQMYKICPKSGMDWGCNESHILSLKWCLKQKKFRNTYSQGDTVNMTVRDYLDNTNVQERRYLMLYRVGVEYPQKNVPLPPYLFGAWLGDGTAEDSSITAIEPEIINEIQHYCYENGLKITVSGKKNSLTWRICSKKKHAKNVFLSALWDLKVKGNKHIPECYLINDIESRLQLLAGIIDTDGNYNGKAYEVTQKNKRLSCDLQRLVQSLGLKCTIYAKVATMKRTTGTIYECRVYRCRIYGDLSKIPCKIARKKANNKPGGRNSLYSGFHVVDKGIGNYYGFNIDGNSLFLLGDYTVTHNTKAVNVYDRWTTVKKCLEDNTGEIIGKSIHTSTVEEMVKEGGQNYLKLWKESNTDTDDFRKLGQTKSGLWRYFLPAYMGYAYDDYGYPKVEESKKKLQEERDQFKDDPHELVKVIRKNPWTPMEAFWLAEGGGNFNSQILQETISMLQFDADKYVRRGNLKWEDGKQPFGVQIGDPSKTFHFDCKVEFEDHPNGRFEFSYFYSNPNDYNKYFTQDKIVWPGNMDRGVAGSDPFKFKVTKKSEKSKGGGAAFLMHDPNLDPMSKPREQWITDRFMATYLFRPFDGDEFAEDMVMMCVYLGIQMNTEITVPIVWEHFDRRGLNGYLYYHEDINGKVSVTPGVNTLGPQIEHIFSLYERHIQQNGRREKHLTLLQQCLDIEDDMGPYDLFAAGGMALKAAKTRRFQVQEPPKELSTVVRRYKYDRQGKRIVSA